MGGGRPPEIMTIIRYTQKRLVGSRGPRYSAAATGYKNLDEETKAAIMAALGIVPTSEGDLMSGTINVYESK
jgi:hypothetical protein